MITRGGFIASGAAFAVAGPDVALGENAFGRRLRIGVVSDPHVKGAGTEGPLEKALRFFDRMKVDGVACCGDLATSGIVPELERVGSVWDRVFPGGRRSDGGKVENLFIYGDHDMGGYSWREARGLLPDEELKRLSIPANDPSALWEKCFHEPWSPVTVKNVKGYRFVLAHHPVHGRDTKWGDFIPGVEEALRKYRAELSGGKPFFYLQHRLLKNTVGGAAAWGQDAGAARKALEAFPGCIALTGHGHIACTDERCIWQGEFTALEVPSLRYCVPFAGCENSPSLPSGTGDEKTLRMKMPMQPIAARDARQGFLIDVHDRFMTVRRLDFAYADGDRIAADWVVPLPATKNKPFATAARAAVEKPARFASGASVKVRRVTVKNRGGERVECFEVSFPPAIPDGANPRANRYQVMAVDKSGCKVVKEVYSARFYLAEAFDGGRVKCLFPVEELAGPAEDIVFTARPLGAFGAKGLPIS